MIPTREEFAVLIVHHAETLVAFGQAKTASGVHMLHDQAEASGRRVIAAYDAALARIAELESPAHRAKVVREFEAEVDAEWFGESSAPSIDGIRTNVLARWEAAAKEGE